MTKWITLFVLGFNSLVAQSISFTGDDKNPIQITEEGILLNPTHSHQYVTDKWATGTLFYLNNTSKPYDSLNFERHSNSLKVVVNNKNLTLMPMGLKGVVIKENESSNYVILVVKLNNKSRFVIIESYGTYLLGSYLLVNKPPINYSNANNEILFTAKKNPKLVVNEKFIVLNNGVWQAFKLNKPAISKLFKIDKKELQKQASANGISTDNRNGLVQLFQLVNIK